MQVVSDRSVESLDFGEIEIDVIVIHNSDATPFYLTENFQSVMPNNIYTRVMDSNTPKNKSADLPHIETLWKKRFGLLSSPLERMMIYLKNPDLWKSSPNDYPTKKQYYSFFLNLQSRLFMMKAKMDISIIYLTKRIFILDGMTSTCIITKQCLLH